MNAKQHRRSPGFTLVELLVVIAIISILASIVVPRVTTYIARARVAAAVSEIRSADTALSAMLADVGRSRFSDILTANARACLHNVEPCPPASRIDTVAKAQDFYNGMFYELLRQGKNSEFARNSIVPEVRSKLGTSYMDLGVDKWGSQYNFWLGSKDQFNGTTILRSYRATVDGSTYIYNGARKQEADARIPGNPQADGQNGFPAPIGLPVYIYSRGANGEIDANILLADPAPEASIFFGGGDDPNNWDNARGWEDAPEP